jgi:hypothetical protein
MALPIQLITLACVVLAITAIARLHLQLRDVLTNQEDQMADFTALNQDLADIPAAIAGAADRIQAAFAAATAADADQAQVDAAKTQLDTALAQIGALGQAVVPAPTGPTGPTDPNAPTT